MVVFLVNFVPKDPIHKNSASVQKMTWSRIDDKQFSGPMVANFINVYVRHSASMS